MMGARGMVAAGALAAVLLTGCGGGGRAAPESTPAGAVVLSENQPSSVGGAQVVATGVDGDRATLSITTRGPARATDVAVGDRIEIGGTKHRVEAVWSQDEGDQPGSMGGRVMVVPEDD